MSRASVRILITMVGILIDLWPDVPLRIEE